MWLDSAFVPPESARKNVEGELFMVHGGFYYQVEKRKIYPGELPKILHWFKWEATLTWLTGFSLLIALYYLRGASLLIDPSIQSLSQGQAVLFSVFIIAFSWFVYDLLWNAKLIPSKAVSVILSVLFFTGVILFNFKIFSGRGAFIQTGAIFGTLMLLNVWIRILPGQTKMIKDAQAGKIPDYSVSLKSKVRSVHNTYFTFPVLFIMLSNHYPAIYNSPVNVWLLIGLAVSGALVRHAMVTKVPRERWTLLPASIGLAALVFTTAQPPIENPLISAQHVEFQQVNSIISMRCLACHSSNPTDDVFKAAPKGLIFESEAQIRAVAENIFQQVVVGKTMPLANKTQMTEEERSVLAQWLKQELKH
jgi:uncharacterized membrane protein